MNRLIASLTALVLFAGVAIAADSSKSGLAVGDGVAAFHVKDVTGPSAGKSLCYRCEYGGNPTACVFTREITPEVAALVASIDKTVGENKGKGMKAFVVLLTDDAEGGAKKLAEVAKDKGIKNVPLTLYDGKTGPDAYKISKDAAVTVLLWNKSKVAANHGFTEAKISEEGQKAVVAAANKMVGG